MMRILSADFMAQLSRENIKKLVKKYTNANITDDGADAIAKLLEKKAREISSFAVRKAKEKKKDRITKEEINEYILKHA
ncbi:MAG: NFYB/HAP3 family transcription factor subunit [Candidatus Micrarchaeota archaeon]|jgi:histone H3/H4